MKKRFFPIALVIFLFTWVSLTLFSFTQKELNLTIYNFPIIRSLIAYLVNLGYHLRLLNTLIFIVLAVSSITCYLLLCVGKRHPSKKQLAFTVFILLISGVVSYPAFSHDIFNYLFYPRMILVHNANPYYHTALDFSGDLWTRFMHNVHLTNPYGQTWTALLVFATFPFIRNFTLSFWAVKFMIGVLFVLQTYVVYKISLKNTPGQSLQRTLLFLFNPLLLTETLIVGHNDSVMMLFLLLAIYCRYFSSYKKATQYITAFLFWISSILVKYATIVMLPVFIIKEKFKNFDIFTWGGVVLLLVPLSRPDQVHSWYLQWGITLLLLSKKSWGVVLAVLLSVGGLLRYVPFVYYGNWDSPVPHLRWVILLLPLMALFSKKVRRTFC
ncbi:MAG: hypothetical protein ACOX6V_04115 [Patescibacteria group bacterium]|jgi:hypothetical protein